jgi:hypothetical protein
MNLDLDFSLLTRFFRGVLDELRQKRLWPAAIVLIAALVAVPVLLTKSSTPPPVAQVPLPTPPPSPGTTLPTISDQVTPSHSQLTGPGRNPFAGAAGASPPTSTSAASTVSAGVASATNAAGSAVSALTGGSSASSSASSGPSPSTSSTAAPATGGGLPSFPSGSSSAPPSITGNAKPKPAPSGLQPNQAYDVALSVTNSAGGVVSLNPLERLTVVPSPQKPLLVELGVLQGGKRVLFAVQPGTVVEGPGTCTPGPVDCEILSLGQDQTEAVGTQVGNISASEEALFAITGIKTSTYPSSAAAAKARRGASAAGQALLATTDMPALSLFHYEPSLGYVVDLRNLTGGR